MKYLKITFYSVVLSLLICSFFNLLSFLAEEDFSFIIYMYFTLCAVFFVNFAYGVLWVFKKIDELL